MSDLETQLEAARRRIAGRTITESNDMSAAIRSAAGMAPAAPPAPPGPPEGVDQATFDAAVKAEVARQRPPGRPREQLQSGSVTPFDQGPRTPNEMFRQWAQSQIGY